MIDENAFGVLIDYFDIEDDEYSEDDTETFKDRFTAFERLILERCAEAPPAGPARVITLGHSVFIEFEQEACRPGLLRWVKELRASLDEHEFRTAVVVTHGGRWVDDDASNWVQQSESGSLRVAHVSLPSEPLRRALFAIAACHSGGDQSWGPGAYLDTEAVEALGIQPKNEPTRLSVAGADFFRVG